MHYIYSAPLELCHDNMLTEQASVMLRCFWKTDRQTYHMWKRGREGLNFTPPYKYLPKNLIRFELFAVQHDTLKGTWHRVI
jgi:hypothetical protein